MLGHQGTANATQSAEFRIHPPHLPKGCYHSLKPRLFSFFVAEHRFFEQQKRSIRCKILLKMDHASTDLVQRCNTCGMRSDAPGTNPRRCGLCINAHGNNCQRPIRTISLVHDTTYWISRSGIRSRDSAIWDDAEAVIVSTQSPGVWFQVLGYNL